MDANRPEARATGSEWRTAPLWGIGLTERVSGHTYFLHDGRARSLLEASLWHGGEAAPSRDAVLAMTAAERDALVAYTKFPFVDAGNNHTVACWEVKL